MTLGKYISLATDIKPSKSDLLVIAVGMLDHLTDLHANGKVHARLQLSSIRIALEADTNCVTGLTVSAGSPDEPLSWKCECFRPISFPLALYDWVQRVHIVPVAIVIWAR